MVQYDIRLAPFSSTNIVLENRLYEVCQRPFSQYEDRTKKS